MSKGGRADMKTHLLNRCRDEEKKFNDQVCASYDALYSYWSSVEDDIPLRALVVDGVHLVTASQDPLVDALHVPKGFQN